MTRFLHPWFGLVFNLAFLFQFLNWFVPMQWTQVDKKWLQEAKAYFTNKEALAPKDTGFFNGGQKLYFWSIVFSAIIFFITGILLWFDHVVPRWIVAVSYALHDIAAVIMLLGFIAHTYETTAAQPKTFRQWWMEQFRRNGLGPIIRDGTRESQVVIRVRLMSVRGISRASGGR